MSILNYETVTTVGLAMDMVGVIMLFYFGMPPRLKTPKAWDGKLIVSSPYRTILSPVGSEVEPTEEHRKWMARWRARNTILSYLAITLVVLGFGLQIWAVHL